MTNNPYLKQFDRRTRANYDLLPNDRRIRPRREDDEAAVRSIRRDHNNRTAALVGCAFFAGVAFSFIF